MNPSFYGTGIPLYGCHRPFGVLNPMGYQHFRKIEYLSKGFFAFLNAYNRYGLMNKAGRIVIEAQWDQIQMEQDAPVIRCKYGSQTVLFDTEGNTLTGRPIHELITAGSGVSVLDCHGNVKILNQLSVYKDGLARSYTAGTTYYVNPKGQIVLTVEGHQCGDFQDGYAVARKRNGLFKRDTWGFIDRNGNFLVPPRYRSALPFSCGVAVVQDEKGCHFLTTDRTTLECYMMVDCERKALPFPNHVDEFVNNFTAALYLGKTRGYVLDGVPFSVPVEEGGYVVMHKSGSVTHNKFYNHLIASGIGNRFIFNEKPLESGVKLYGVMDPWGKVLIPPLYERIYPDGEDCFRLELGGKVGLADRDGKIITEAQWDKLLLVREGAFNVSRDGQWGLMGTDGKWLFPLGKEGPYILWAGAVLTEKGSNLQLCNLDNQPAIPDILEPIEPIAPGLLMVRYMEQYCILDYGFTPEA